MRSVREIRRVYRSRAYRELKKVYEKYLSKKPTNCVYNKRTPLPGTDKDIGICMLFSKYDEVRADKGLWICDQPEDAQNCSKFDCRHCKSSLKKAFEAEVLSCPDKMKESYKDLYILSWLLQDDELSWYKRWWNKLLGRSSGPHQKYLGPQTRSSNDKERAGEAVPDNNSDYTDDPGPK